ncbi:thiamine pyrophosphate-dependent enzyme [Leifsonia shinshuensis]|uniref:Phosphonopyruvate decarboxylase n=1 Tax=Leifsonia shinshuensis TaxID=150026 RepID=A0A7G6YAU8_9MICO|nr:thiamine pyrophosphate-dependent enzyme [Leifsonia shinshuensis]QNE35613.1 phosphonopyruvate decarboxylase [Leifsonia shinshuensis]
MIECCRFVDALADRGWAHAGGVPCSTFGGPIGHLTAEGRYRPAANEGLALSDAAGAWLGGRRQAVFLQNSGFGNLLNPLTSLSQPYGIPVLAFMSMRGWPDPAADEPQHAIMGSTLESLLAELGVWAAPLTDADPESVLDRAADIVDSGRPAFVLVPFRSIGAHPRTERGHSNAPSLPDTAEVAQAISRACDADWTVFATTGYASRFLHAAGDRPANFYMQGSMGHVSSLALGYATAQPERPVVVIDGDGAALMQLGAFSTIGAARPRNLLHVVIDNGGYESTGGQASSAPSTDFVAIARACGYASAWVVESITDLDYCLVRPFDGPGPRLIVVRAGPVRGEIPHRAGASLGLADVAARVRRQAVDVDVLA